jgi:hypothetical protein
VKSRAGDGISVESSGQADKKIFRTAQFTLGASHFGLRI